MKHIIWFVSIFLLLIIVPFDASRGVMKKVAFTTLVESSANIVRGTVADMNSYWGDDHRAIYTDLTVAVSEQYKGDSGAGQITVTILGGNVDGLGLMVEDVPRFSNGQEVILFLNPKGDVFQINCLYQGKYTVEDEVVVERGTAVTGFVARILDTIDVGEER